MDGYTAKDLNREATDFARDQARKAGRKAVHVTWEVRPSVYTNTIAFVVRWEESQKNKVVANCSGSIAL